MDAQLNEIIRLLRKIAHEPQTPIKYRTREDNAAMMVAATTSLEGLLEGEVYQLYLNQHESMQIKTEPLTRRDFNKIVRDNQPEFSLKHTTRKGVQTRVWKNN